MDVSEVFQYQTDTKVTLRGEISTLKADRKWSYSEKLLGFTWLNLTRKVVNEDKVSFLTTSLSCNKDFFFRNWYCDAKITIRFLSQNRDGKHYVYDSPEVVHFSPENDTMTIPNVISWTELTDKAKHFVTSVGFVYYEIEMKIVRSYGMHKTRLCTFGTKREGTADIILKVEGKRVAVCSTLLAIRSPFFDNLFSTLPHKKKGETDENDDFDYEIEGISYESFISVLKAMLPVPLEPEASRPLLDILKWANKWKIQDVKKRCDNYIYKNQNMSVCKKIGLAWKFGLPITRAKVPKMLDSVKAVEEAMYSYDYELISDSAKVIILEIARDLYRRKIDEQAEMETIRTAREQ